MKERDLIKKRKERRQGLKTPKTISCPSTRYHIGLKCSVIQKMFMFISIYSSIIPHPMITVLVGTVANFIQFV